MPAHIGQRTTENVAGVLRMPGIDLCVLRAIQVVKIVALNGLMKEGQAQRQHQRGNNKNLLYHSAIYH